jgi:hypothetical protein
MKKGFIFMLLLMAAHSLAAQEYRQLFTLPLDEKHFTTDPLGNIYLFSKGDITRYDAEGRETGKYSSRYYGTISYVDASNPMKILVVFAEFSKAVILDAGMAANSNFDLKFPDVPFVKLLCTSRSDGYWFFDPVQKKLKKINDQNGILAEGTPFRQITDAELTPVWIGDSGKWLLANVPDYGILVFDNYGTYFKTIRPGATEMVQANGDLILTKNGTTMIQTDIRSAIVKTFLIPQNDPSDKCRLEGNRVFISHEKSLVVYSY